MEITRDFAVSKGWRGYAATATLVLILFIGVNVFATFYIQQEHAVYFWDWATFWTIYKKVCSLAQTDPSMAMFYVQNTIDDDYGALAILPLTPVARIFGDGRLPYILAIVDISLLASVLALTGFLLRTVGQVRAGSSPVLFFTVSLAILCSHVLWIPALRGLPDVLGVFMVGIVLITNFAKPITAHSLRRTLLTGFLLCLLVLLRRWYLFWVVAFFPAFLFAQCIGTRRLRRDLDACLTACKWTFTAGSMFVVAMYMLAESQLMNILTVDYADIYSAYHASSSLLQTAVLFYAHFGLLDLLIASIGLGLLIANGTTRAVGLFFVTQAVIMFVLFGRTQDPAVHHFYLFFPALAAGIGTVIIHAWTKINNRAWSVLLVAGCFAGVLASSEQVLSTTAHDHGKLAQALLPSVRFPPLKRNDLDQLDAMLAQAMTYRGVYVAASSFVINGGALKAACLAANDPTYHCDKILWVSDIDKRDGFPEGFFRATLAVSAVPVQYHLDPSGQRVVGMLARDLENGTGVGAAFRRLDVEYRLDDSVTMHAFARVRPNTQQEKHALSSELVRFYPDKLDTFTDAPTHGEITTQQRLCARFPTLMRLMPNDACALPLSMQPHP